MLGKRIGAGCLILFLGAVAVVVAVAVAWAAVLFIQRGSGVGLTDDDPSIIEQHHQGASEDS